MTNSNIIPKGKRLDDIFDRIKAMPPCRKKKEILKQIRDVFKEVEDTTELHHLNCGIELEGSAEKMMCPPDLITSKDQRGQSFIELKHHILIVSSNGAFGVYGLNQTTLLRTTSDYESEDPQYFKLSASGLDVFGRKPSC